ncbi:ankyrin repeat-containing domain protein [Aspergillus spectabilis]
MSHGAEVNERNEAGENAVHHAIHCGHISAVHVLLSYGADPNNISNCVSGLPSPIDIAAEDGHAEIIRMLIAHGASVNAARNPYHGITPLFYAERNGHTEAAMILREAGALPFGPGNPIRCINPPVSEVQCENAHLSQPALLNESDTAKTSETNQSEEEEIEDIRRQMAL